MPLQNRVAPDGSLYATSARGTLMGNRGKLHDEAKQVVRSMTTKGWVICSLSHKGIKRELMSNSYTELFFLDEVTALAAGHRPCNDCMKAKFKEFKTLWLSANEHENLKDNKMSSVDNVMHKQRYLRGSKVTYFDEVHALPSGVIFRVDNKFYLKYENQFFLWSFDGYTLVNGIFEGQVEVITPKSTVNAIESGYEPSVHSSANTN